MYRAVFCILAACAAAMAGPLAAPLRNSDQGAPAGTAGREPASSFPTYDTLCWHDYTVSQLCHGGPTSGNAWLFGLGAKYTPDLYPCVIVGLSERVYRDPRSPSRGLMEIQLVADDGPGGSPGTMIRKVDVQADTWDWYFHYRPMEYPYDTVWEGSFYLFYLSRDSGSVRYTLLWPYDLALNYLENHWWHQNGQYAVCTNITADLSFGAVVEYGDVGVAEPNAIPGAVVLLRSEPSPFRERATLRYGLPARQNISVEVYDIAGNRVRELHRGLAEPGYHSVTWDGTDESGLRASPGLYICRLRAGDRMLVSKLLKTG